MISVYPDHEAMSQAAAALFVEQAVRAVAAQGRCAVLLAGGETPRLTYELLAGEQWRKLVPWDRLHFFWGDERCVLPDDPRNNAGMVCRVLLNRVPVRAAQVHPISCGPNPCRAAEEYEELLRMFFARALPRFDVALLGLGIDGHTASLFPGSAALEEQERWTAVTRRSGEDIDRVTLTVPVINQAELILFLVSGDDKAAILHEVLDEEPAPSQYPAGMIRPEHGEQRWLVDKQAAHLLMRTDWDMPMA